MKYLLLFVFTVLQLSFAGIKKKEFIPPGTVKITERFFADIYEVSNQAWKEYEHWTKNFYGIQSKEHLAVIPDTMVWLEKWAFNELYTHYYYVHPAFANHPVVGISYEQAKAYCLWRTARVKEQYALRYKKALNIEYRLPEINEWEQLCAGLNPITIPTSQKGESNYNLRVPTGDTLVYTKSRIYDITAPCKSYSKNKFGLYNLIGNVAEMTNQKGICKGGGWLHFAEQALPGKNMKYESSNCWLGFRCVAVISNPE